LNIFSFFIVLRNQGATVAKYSDPDAIKYQILLSLAEFYSFLFTKIDDPKILSCAFSCLDLARDLGSSFWISDIYSQLAAICELQKDSANAQLHYENSLGFDPFQLKSLIRMGAIERATGKNVLAHDYLTTALKIDSTSHEAWFQLGLVLKSQKRFEDASQHFLTALELERNVPAHSFYLIPRML
jgi:tetratricopeptide (TPR) repeat protein